MNYLNTFDMENPKVNFDEFFDGESLLQEDLVLWLNLGMHHIPHTGDLPNTVFTTARTAIQITPSNYFMYDQSRVSREVLIASRKLVVTFRSTSLK